jgi:hypothetical protein
MVCVDFSDLTPPRKRHRIHEGINISAHCYFQGHTGTVKREKLKLKVLIKGEWLPLFVTYKKHFICWRGEHFNLYTEKATQ